MARCTPVSVGAGTGGENEMDKRMVCWIVIGVIASRAMSSLANPIVLPREGSEIISEENLRLLVSSNDTTVSGTVVFTSDDSQLVLYPPSSDSYLGYLCVPVYLPINQSNTQEIVSAVDLRILCNDIPVETKLISGSPVVNREIDRRCPDGLRIVWFAARMKKTTLARVQRSVFLSYKQKHFLQNGSLQCVYTPLIYMTRNALQSTSAGHLENYKKTHRITVCPDTGVSLALTSTHSVLPEKKGDAMVVTPIDLESLVVVVEQTNQTQGVANRR